MPQVNARKPNFTYLKGLITETSPLAFAENSALDMDNFELNPDGTIQRRLGLDYESGYSEATITVDNTDVVSEHEWRSPGGDPSLRFIVVQIGENVHFYKDATAFSANKKAFTIDLSLYATGSYTASDIAGQPIDCATGKGILLIVNKYISPLHIEYSVADDTINITPINIEIRDFIGANDGLGNEEQPNTLTDAHKYNLMNQGWSVADINQYYTDKTKYPANAFVRVLGLIQNPTTNVREWNSNEMARNLLNNGRAPKGRFIINPFNTTATLGTGGLTILTISSFSYSHGAPGTITVTTSAAHGYSNGNTVQISGTQFRYMKAAPDEREYTSNYNGSYTISNVAASTFDITKTINGWDSWVDQYEAYGSVYKTTGATEIATNPDGFTTNIRPRKTAWYAGRAWYAGIDDTHYQNWIFFSQIVQGQKDYEKCYQENDPTSEHFNSLLPTDGGYLIIPEIENIQKMLAVQDKLLVFAENGIWIIQGQRGSFNPVSYSIQKLTGIGLSSPFGVCLVDGLPIYSTVGGLYVMQQDPDTGFLFVTNLTKDTIQDIWDAIATKNRIKMVYDESNRKVHILHNTTATTEYQYNRELVVHLKLGAFYKFSYPTSPGRVIGISSMRDYAENNNKVKYLSYKTSGTKVSWCTFSNTSFKDFYTMDSTGTDAAGYLTTGYEVMTDATVKKYAPWIYCFFRQTETTFVTDGAGGAIPSPASSCTMQARWDWSDHANSGKYGDAKEVYKHRRQYVGNVGDPFTSGFDVVVTKNKVRGSGRALHIHFSTTAAKDCQMLGWSVDFQGVT